MLQKLGFAPGFNKQVTETGAESQWTGGENVRFRYGTPEKIGGWNQLGESKLTGVTRDLHHFVNKASIKYAAIGTNRILYVYSNNVYYDIHPIKTDFGALTDKLACTSGSPILTITLSSTAGMTAGDILFLESVTPPTSSGYSAADFDDKTFMITEVVDATSVTITMGTNASASATDGDLSVKYYYPVGSVEQVAGYGWGTSSWGGTTGWGSETPTSSTVIEPGQWSLDNLGQTLIALIVNGPCFEWDANAGSATSTRATIISGAPTASRDMVVSTPDRHLVFFGTETTIGDPTTQDDMFIRFSSQENINDYAPTATNSAGTQRLAAGSRIMGAKLGRNAIYVWSDTSLFIMRFVGAPFTFAFEQVGTNCGLLGKNAAVEIDGAAYWMSDNGFFRYTGRLESMQCFVEDYVYDNINTDSNQLIYCGINNLFGEITWFYPTSTSNTNNRSVTYNYLDSTKERPIWSTNASSLFTRTTWEDSAVFGLPHASKYDAGDDDSFDVVGNTDGVSIYFEHETGVNQQEAGVAAVAVPASITSGDYDITQKVVKGAASNMADLRGDGESIMRVSRIIPDFVSQTGDAIIQLDLRDYPNDAAASSPLGPFTLTTSTKKVDTRARARAVALTISNTAVDSSWKLGTFRLDIQSGGRR